MYDKKALSILNAEIANGGVNISDKEKNYFVFKTK